MKRSKNGKSSDGKGKIDKRRKIEKAIAAETAFSRALKKYHRKIPLETAVTLHREVKELVGYKQAGKDPAIFWQKVLKREGRFQVRKHKAAYVEALAEVLKIYEYICSMPFSKFVEHVKELCAHNNTDPSKKKFNLLRLVLMYVIDYTCKLKKNRSGIDTHDLSRDAQALSWLMSKGIGSEKLVAYHRKHGGGVDKWSRRASKKVASASEKWAELKREAENSLSNQNSVPAVVKAKAVSSNGQPASAAPLTARSQAKASPTAKVPAPKSGTKSIDDDVLGQIADAFDLDPGESLFLHLRGTVSKPGVALVRGSKVDHVGPPGFRRVQAERLNNRIRKLIANVNKRRHKRA